MTEAGITPAETDALQAVEAFWGPERAEHRAAAYPAQDERTKAEFVPVGSRALAIRNLQSCGLTNFLTFANLPSQSETRWLIPLGNNAWTTSGLNVYRPIRLQARLRKRVLAAAISCGWSGWVKELSIIGSRQKLRIEELVNDLTGEANPVFSLSLGTKGPRRKLVVRVMRSSGALIGYIKISMAAASRGTVMREAATLERLSRCSVLDGEVPTLLYRGSWGDGYMFFQSGVDARPAPKRFGEVHRLFLEKLALIGRLSVAAETVVQRIVGRWDQIAPRLPVSWRTLGSDAFSTAYRYLSGKEVSCGLSHGDFAPWNTLLLNDRLFVYDWESAEWEQPLVWDAMHFAVQCGVFLGQRTGFREFTHSSNVNLALFLLYLLDSARESLADGSAQAMKAADCRYQILVDSMSRL